MNKFSESIENEAKELALYSKRTAYIVVGKTTGRLFVSLLMPIHMDCLAKVTPDGKVHKGD